MLDFSQIEFDQIIVHKVGNIANGEDVKMSRKALSLNEEVEHVLTRYFLMPFKGATYYHFDSDTAMEDNEMYSLATDMFEKPDLFVESSQKMAQRLFEQTDHPNINGGEFYVVFFKDVVKDDEMVDAIGLFKSENNDTFIKVFENENNYEVSAHEGININKLDKGCLIYQTEKEHGYVVSIVDKTAGRGSEAVYWKEKWLGIKQRTDEFYQTNAEMTLVKDFCADMQKKEHEINKVEEVEMMNKAVEYFVEKEHFDVKEFEKEVISKPELIQSFRDYKADYQEQNAVELPQEFEISPKAVNESKKRMRSVLKLDSNFHIYVHGAADMIERSFDEVKGMKCYKLYFDKES